MAFSAPWVADPLSSTKGAFVVFTGFYVVCGVVTWALYLRRPVRATAWPAPGSEPRPRADPSPADRDPLPLLLPAVRDAAVRARAPEVAAWEEFPVNRGRAVPQGLDRRPGCTAAASG